MNIELIRSSGHSPVSHKAVHIRCILSSVLSPAYLNSSAGTSSGPALFPFAISLIALATSDLSGAGSRVYVFSFPTSSLSADNSSQYSLHLSPIIPLSLIFSPSLELTQTNCGLNVFVSVFTVWNTCFIFPFLFDSSSFSQIPSICFCLSPLNFLCSSFLQFFIFLSVLGIGLSPGFDHFKSDETSDIHEFCSCFLLYPIVVLADSSRIVLTSLHSSSGVLSFCSSPSVSNRLLTSKEYYNSAFVPSNSSRYNLLGFPYLPFLV